ncbi:1286_t:CDS:2, partial [Cetraspora pellucida]
MVLQLAENGDLRSYLCNHFSELDWITKIKMAKDISSGVNYLHNANIIHLDIVRNLFCLVYLSLFVMFVNITIHIPDPVRIALQVIEGKRENPVNGTPVDFMNIYCDAWSGDPNLRPSIDKIRVKLNYIRMVPIYHSEKDIGISSNDTEFNSSKLDDADDSIQDMTLI